MTSEEIVRLKKEIIACSAYYERKIDDQVLNMYVDDLKDIPLNDVLFAYNKWRQNPKNMRFPFPAQIRGMLKETITDEDKARDAANRIKYAIASYGYPNSESARKYMGELAWKIVERQGGWKTICERTMNDELPFYQAQWEKYGISLIHFFESGKGEDPPGLPEKLALVQNILQAAMPKRIE